MKAEKTERITVMVSPGLKRRLADEAKARGISVSALVRHYCEDASSQNDELLLSVLTAQLTEANGRANASLDAALAAAAWSRHEIQRLRAAAK